MDELLREIFFDAHPDPMWIYSRDSLRFLEVNEAAVARYGYSREQFLAMTIADIRPSRDIHALRESVEKGEHGLDQAEIWRHRLRSGEIVLVEIIAHATQFKGQSAELVLARSANGPSASDEPRRILEVIRDESTGLRTAQRLLGLGLWSLDVAAGRLTWSDEVHEIYGVQAGKFGETYEDYVGLVHPDDREAMQEGFEAFAASDSLQFSFGHRIVTPAGVVRHVRGMAEKSGPTEKRRLVGVVQDVTSQVEADRTLRESELRLRMAGRLARLGAWKVRLDSDPPRVIWSDETAEIHGEAPGYSPSEAEAINYYVPEHRDKIRLAFETCASNGQSFDEVLQILAAGGKRVWVRALGEAETDERGRIVAVQGAFQDISDLVAAREAARESDRRLRETLESISDAFYTLDSDWNFLYLNSQAEVFLGRSRNELLGRSIWDEYPEALDSRFEREYRRAVRENRKVDFVEHYPPLEAWFDVSAYPTDEGLAVYFRDVTERKKLEARLHQAQKLEAVGQLTGGLAHDFNNLLCIVILNAEVLCEELQGRPSLLDSAQSTLAAAEKGARLTRSLLAFSRRQALRPETIDVGRLLLEVDHLLRRTLPEQIEIELVRSGGLWKAEVDASQLESAILNLALNARDAMPQGGRLTIETANTRLDDDYARDHEVAPGQYVLVSVTDTGVGMTAEESSRAFEPFYTTKPVGQGSGLGLSMVYGFVKQSRGHVKVYSEPGEGTAIKMYFPRAATEQPSEVRPTSSTDSDMTGQGHVLVVEDDEQVRRHVCRLVERLGYVVSRAASGPEALEVLERTADIDLLFTDVVMPGGMSGRDLAEAALQRWPNLKILYSSGYTENAIVHQGRLDPGVELLSKPYRKEELASKFRRILRKCD